MLFGTFLVGCGDKPARHPVMKKTSTFLKESAKKNKALLKTEEALIDSIIKKGYCAYFCRFAKWL